MTSSILGRTNAMQNVRIACKKCGYSGHLTYQCRNFLKTDPNKDVVLDVSSTSSGSSDEEDFISPLVQEALAMKSEKREADKTNKSRKRKHHSRSRSEDRQQRGEKKRKVSHKESVISDLDGSSSDSSSSNRNGDETSKKKHRKRKRHHRHQDSKHHDKKEKKKKKHKKESKKKHKKDRD